MNEQPEALRLADMIERYNAGVHSQAIVEDYSRAADELRRLHEADEAFGKRQEWWNDRMFEMETALRQAVEALEAIAVDAKTTSNAYETARQAIAAAKQALGEAMSIDAMKLALEALELWSPALGHALNKRAEAVVALRAAIEQAQEPVAWLTKELMADYLDMTAEAIENNGSEMLRNKAYWMRVKGDIVSIAAMKQALEFIDSVKVHPTQIATRDALHTALRAAIEQAEKQEPVGEVLNERGEVDYISYVPPVGTPFYTAPQSINDFKPDWDTVKAYDEKFAEMLDEQQRLRAELKRTEQRLHDVATLCANVEGVLKAVNTAAMKLTADLTCMEIDNDDRLDRDHVMERVMRWRNEWDKAMFEYKPKVTQRKPLTDERIALIAAASGGLASDFVITVARAIEAAHGIGERK